MTVEEVAVYGPASCCSPNTEVFREKFKREFLENQKLFLAEISRFVSGAYDSLGGCKRTLFLQLFSWSFSKEFVAGVR